MLETIITFINESQNKKVINQLTQLLGKQRKQEKMLLSERTYTPRVQDSQPLTTPLLKEIDFK